MCELCDTLAAAKEVFGSQTVEYHDTNVYLFIARVGCHLIIFLTSVYKEFFSIT